MGSSIPFELPLKASESAALAEILFQQLEGRPINDEQRNRLAARAAALKLDSIRPYFGSLQQDPVHSSTYYLAAETVSRSGDESALLLRFAPASAPSSALFPNAMLIGRMRPGGGREVVVNAIPFSSTDADAIRTFVQQVDPAFLPRPQGTQPAVAVGNRHPEISLPAAFDAFSRLLKSTGVNYASTVQLSATREMTTPEAIAARDGENPTAQGHTRVSIPHLYATGLWAAIRAGWREGYSAEADHFIVTGDTPDAVRASVDMVKQAIHLAAGYTKFTTDTSRLFDLRADTRHPNPYSATEIEDRFTKLFNPGDQAWLIDEFSRPFAIGDHTYQFSTAEIHRLAVKFGASLILNEELYDFIRRERASSGLGRTFDFEPSIDEAETLTTPAEMIFYMQWLRSRGRPAQLVPPNLGFKKRQAYPETFQALEKYVHHKMWPELLPAVSGEFNGNPLAELTGRVRRLADIARHYNGTLSIHSGSGKQAAVLNRIGEATNGRWNYKISGELQLQLFDVLSEQPETSPHRRLYNRMVDRCNQFATANRAFGDESDLAAPYAATHGAYLGNAQKGRVDGNLFLVFWLGNMVGSRDIHAPDGDTRFFADKIKELPKEIIEETRRRNSDYIVWLATELRG
ncbi:MAG: hypothetical protein IT168_29875 [Bryobacterales bacterium]|nr:hypothetical protein [Bryobacterales bacterium]